MGGTSTLIAIGSVTVQADTPDTNALFQGVAASVNALPALDRIVYSGANTPQAPSDNAALFIPSSVTGNVTIPSNFSDDGVFQNYRYVVVGNGSHVALFSRVGNATVVGDGFEFAGRAALVASGAGSSTEGVSSIGYGQYVDMGPTSTQVLLAGTATVAAGLEDTVTATSGSHTTIVAGASGHFSNWINVESLAVASISIASGTINVERGARTNILVDSQPYGGVSVNIGATITVPGIDHVEPPVGAAAQVLEHPDFTNVIRSVGLSGYSGFAGVGFTINDPDSVNMIALGLNDAVRANSGASTVFGSGHNDVRGSVFFVGGPNAPIDPSFGIGVNAASTVTGGAGNTTVFATTGDQFDEGAAQANVFVGGTATSTINANAGGGSFFGGAHGDLYNAGTSAAQTFVGLGGADTINTAAGSVAPLVYAENAEHMVLTGPAATTLVAFTHDGSVDLSGTGGSNVVFAGYGASGNQTLIGSTSSFDAAGNPTHDTFVVGGNPNSDAATISIDNWHGGDVLYLSGLDATPMNSAISNNVARGGGGNLTFTLSDSTTVTFVGDHPTNFAGGAAF